MFIFRIYKYTIFLALEKWLKNEHSRRFHSRRFVISANAMAPDRYSTTISKAQGKNGNGQELFSPSSYRFFLTAISKGISSESYVFLKKKHQKSDTTGMRQDIRKKGNPL